MITKQFGNYTIYVSDKLDGSFNFENRGEIFKDFIVPFQVHKNDIFCIEDPNDINLNVDGFFTNLRNTKIAVKLADCNGIVLMGKDYFAVLHAGWRGLESGIIDNSIKLFVKNGENLSEIKVFIGPSIRQCCYKVSEDFSQKFDAEYLHRNGDDIHFDMIGFIQDKFVSLGINNSNIETDTTCTHCSDTHFSYRKSRTDGRFVVGVEKIKIITSPVSPSKTLGHESESTCRGSRFGRVLYLPIDKIFLELSNPCYIRTIGRGIWKIE